MKATYLKIENIGIIEDFNLEINKPLIIFYGDIRQGKTTILNSIKWLAGGGIQKDLIRHGENEAFIELGLENGKIRREFYINKSNEIKARKIEAIMNNCILSQKQVALLFNPFLLDQNHFTNMNASDKAKFLIEVFGLDTSDLDHVIKSLENSAKDLRIDIKAFGEIDTTEVDKPETETLKIKEGEIRKALNDKVLENRTKNQAAQKAYKDKIDKYNKNVEDWKNVQDNRTKRITDANNLLIKLIEQGYVGNEVSDWINEFLKPEEANPFEMPNLDLIEEMPDQTELNKVLEQISNAKADEILYSQYLARIEKQKEKEKTQDILKEKELKLKEVRLKKRSLLNTISGKIKTLEFNESGDFYYDNTSSARLSDSQQMELSSKLSALYPEGLAIELIDRGESLGKSINLLTEHAKENNRNILVTVVGDKPTKIDDEIGVFVVEKGNVK